MTANQNIIDLIARRYSSPTDAINNVVASTNNKENVRKSSASDIAIKIPEETQTQHIQQPQTPTSPSTMLNKLSPGNIFKNIFK